MLERTLISPWKWLLGLFLLAGLVISVNSTVGWGTTLASWQALSPLILVLAFGCFALSHLLRAWRIFRLVTQPMRCSYLSTIKLSAIHQFANNLLPMRLGEFVFPLLLQQYYQTSLSSGMARLIWLRILDLAVMLSVLILFVMLRFDLLLASGLILLAALSVLLGWLMLNWLEKLPLLKTLVKQFRSARPDSRALTLELLFITLIAWGCKLVALVFLAQQLTSLPFTTLFAGILGTEFSAILPVHGIGGAGTYEASFIAASALSQFEGVNNALIGIAVNLHLFTFISTGVVMLLSLPFSMKKPQPDVAGDTLNADH